MSKLTHYADKTIEYLFYALFFFVPLLLWPKTSEVFEFNKMLLVYVITILISAAWVVKWIEAKKITIRRTPLDLPIAIFLTSQILSTIFSIDTHTSLWGYYSRFHGGLISTIAYLLLYYALVTNFTRDKVSFAIYSIISSAALVALYGILEHFGIDKHLWVQDVASRVFSTIGQPNWLSAYLVALLPLPIFLAVEARDNNHRLLWALLALLFAITIIFTKSQSGLAATGLILAAVALYFVGRKFKFVYLFILPFILLATILKWDFVVKINPFGVPNLAALVKADGTNRVGGSDSMIIRQVVWQGARKLGAKNPLFGTGLETFGYTYFTVRPALHNLLSEWEFLYNKAHNEYLNFLANTGFVGLAAYLLLIGWTLVWWAQIGGAISRGLLFGYLSILITNYFGFSVVPVALFFFLFPALVFVLSKSKEKYISLNFSINPYLGFLILIPLTLYLLAIPYRQWRADIAYNTGRQYLTLSAYKQSLNSLTKAVSISPNEPLFLAQLAEGQAITAAAVAAQLDSLPATLPADATPSALQAGAGADLVASGQKLLAELQAGALANSDKAVNLNPHHTNLYKSKAKVELYLAVIDPEYNRQAVDTLRKLAALSPTDAKIVYNLGLVSDQLGETKKAQEYYRLAVTLKPDYDAAQAMLKD